MATSSNSTSLPGEHGFHMRDGSLLKKKREQWEREKEEGKNQWFLFGSRCSPCNNKSTALTNNNTSPLANPSPPHMTNAISSTNTNNNNPPEPHPGPPALNWPSPQFMSSYSNQPSFYNVPTCSRPPNNAYLANLNGQYSMQMYTSPGQANGDMAYFTPINFQQPHPPLNNNYNPPYLDPNFTQNPHFNGLTEKMEIVETRYEPMQRGVNGHLSQTACPSNYESTFASISIANDSEGSAFTSFDQQMDGQPNYNRRHVQFCQENEEVAGEGKSQFKGLTEHEINEQIAERQRVEAVLEEKERLELRQVEKDHIKQVNRQQQEADDENSKWKKRQERIEANEKATIMQLEKAKKEAEALRKAKLYKHILLSKDIKEQEIQKVLGIEDPELSDRVMKQLKAFDRQKRLDMDRLNTSVATASPASNHTSGSSRENTPLANGSPGKLERSNTSNSIRSPLASQRKGDSTSTAKQSNGCSPLAGQTMTPLRRNDVGRGSLRIPVCFAKKASPASSSPMQTSSTAAIRRRSGSMERLSKPVSKHPPSRQTNANYSSDNEKTSFLKVSTANPQVASAKSAANKNLPPPVPPPRRHKPVIPQMAEKLDPEAGNSHQVHWSHSYITAEPSHIPVPPPRSGHCHGYDQTIQLLSDLPDVGESPTKASLLRRTNFGLKPAIGLFEPVCTRTRQTKTMIHTQQNTLDKPQNHQRQQNSAGASSVATESESPESSSPISTSPPLSAGYKSRSHYEQNSQSANEMSLSTDISNNHHHKYSEVERILMIETNKIGSERAKAGLITPSSSKDSISEGNNSLKPPRASPFARRLAESAPHKKISAGEHSTPEILRRNLYSPTMMCLQNSIGHLNVVPLAENKSGESLSRPMTPSKPFNCRTTQNYRSLNLKKDTERQHRILEQLAKVRAQLKDRQEKIERSFSNQNLANTT